MKRKILTLKRLILMCMVMWLASPLAFGQESSSLKIELPSPLHFLTPSGDDVEVGPGMYQVEAVEEWVKLIPVNEGPASAILVEATAGEHEAELTDVTVRFEPEAEKSEVFHLAILHPDGTGLEAVGTESGIRPRAANLVFMKAVLTKKRATAFTAKKFSRPNVAMNKKTIGLPDVPQGEKPKVCGPFQKEIGYEGEGRGHRKPALAVYKNQLHLVTSIDLRCDARDVPILSRICGHDSELNPLSHRIYENGKWGKRKTIPKQYSKKGVGLAVLENRLHMVHLGGASNQLWYSTYDGNSWTPNVKIPRQKSKKRPVLATFQNRVHMVHLGDSSNDLWHSMYIPGRGWTVNVRIPGQKSKNTPGLAVYGNRLHMVHAGDSSDDLWHSSFSRGQWTKNTKIPMDSKYSPTLAFSANNSKPWLELIHFEKGGSGLWHSLYGRHLRRGRTWIEWFDARPLASLQSDSSVGLAFFEGCWHMVSVKNDKLMHTTFATSEIHPTVR